MKSDVIREMNYNELMLTLQENRLYKYYIGGEGYAEYLIFKKINDKIIICNAETLKNNELKFYTQDKNDIQYTMIDFESLKNKNIGEFYEIYLEKYDKFMQIYNNSEIINDTLVFESDIPIHKMNINNIQNIQKAFEKKDDKEYFKDYTNPEFLYQMLSRLETDCKYFLGNGNGYEKHLWASTVDNQIAAMKEIYNKLEEKPEWLSLEQINNYEKDMKSKLKEKNSNLNEKNNKKDSYER